jgi:CHAD domain-containing protein
VTGRTGPERPRAGVQGHREEEHKYGVPDRFTLPDLSAALPGGGRVDRRDERMLRAAYYDTDDLRLARSGVTLRYRTGEDAPPWQLKLPLPGDRAEDKDARTELAVPGRPNAVPAELQELVTAWARGKELRRIAVLRTARHPIGLLDGDGDELAEVVDDTVTVLDGRRVVGRFREIEVELADGRTGHDVLSRVGGLLTDAGAERGALVPKVVRALGERAAAPDDLVPSSPGPAEGTAGAALAGSLRATVRRLLHYDPLVRRGAEDAVHQLRVCCRRLRSDLRTYRALVRRRWAEPLRVELRWLAGVLGEPRDAEVLRARLRRTAASDPLAPLNPDAVRRIDRALTEREDRALAALADAMRGERYLRLLDALVAGAASPQLKRAAAEPADEALTPLVAAAWHRLATQAHRLGHDDPDEGWHQLRIQAKRTRYAAEAVAAVERGPARRFARAVAGVQDVLGEHQDAAVAAEVWLDAAAATPGDPTLVLTCGRLAERERAAVWAARDRFPAAWAAVDRPKRLRWLVF